MTETLQFLQTNGAEILQALAAMVAAASMLANFTKTDKDDKALSLLAKIIHFLAGNFFVLKTPKK